MDWLQFWSSIVSSLAWPVCVISVSLIFRKKLSELLAKLSKLELPGGVTGEFRSTLAEVESVTAAVPVSSDQNGQAPRVDATVQIVGAGMTAGAGTIVASGESSNQAEAAKTSSESENDEIRSVVAELTGRALRRQLSLELDSEANPTGLVVEGWKALESAILKTALVYLGRGKIKKVNVLDILGTVSSLQKADVLSSEEADVIRELRRLRNLAAHSSSPLSPIEARRFATQAQTMGHLISSRAIN